MRKIYEGRAVEVVEMDDTIILRLVNDGFWPAGVIDGVRPDNTSGLMATIDDVVGELRAAYSAVKGLTA